MFVMGIDPGLTRCGYGVVTRNGSIYKAVGCGVLTTSLEVDLPCRLAILAADLRALYDDFRPSVVVVERVFFQVNVRTAMSVGQASGLALATAAAHGIEVHQYSANEVKLSITGDGAASKGQVASMVTRLLGLDSPPKPVDATDALALAMCYLSAQRYNDTVKRSSQRNVDSVECSAQHNNGSFIRAVK